MSRYEERRHKMDSEESEKYQMLGAGRVGGLIVIYYDNLSLRKEPLLCEPIEIMRTYQNFNRNNFSLQSSGNLLDRNSTVSTYNAHQPSTYRNRMCPPSPSSRNYRSYELGHFTSQNSRNPSLNTYNNSNKVTFTSFYDSFELNNSNIRNTHFNRKTAAGRTRPYYNMHCSMLRAKKIAKRLKTKEDCEEGIDDLCLLMNIRNKQPLQAVMKELLLLLEEQNKMHNRRSEIDKSTQTVRSRQVVKKEFCTPIPEGFLKSIMETPILPTKMTVKLEKITPVCERSKVISTF